jgi:phosphatidylglycerophosphatase A
MTRVAVFIATAAGCGYFPIAPGTAGAAAGLVLYGLVWWTHSRSLEVALIVLTFAVGVWAATHAERFFGVVDPGQVVIDEVNGMLVTLAFIPVGVSGALAGFFIFRLLDALKPFPANRLESLHGGFGIMADDVMAGVYSNIALRLVIWLVPHWIH